LGACGGYRRRFQVVSFATRDSSAVVCALSLASFAIPLVLGGGPQSSTLEVLIYERIHSEADLSSAAALGFFQCVIQFLVFWLLLRPILLKKERQRAEFDQSRSSIWVLPTAMVALVSVVPIYSLIQTMLPAFSRSVHWLWSNEFLSAAANSLVISLAVGLAVVFLLGALAASGWRYNLISWPAMSGVVVGLGGLILFGAAALENRAILWSVLVWGHLAVIFLPVFRLAGPQIEALRNRFNPPLVQMGSTPSYAMKKVYLPLGARVYLASGILAITWSMGEFSVASLLGPAQSTLPLYIRGLLGNYRLEEAAVGSVVLLFMSAVSMTMFEVLTHGLGRKHPL
jgi:thiamine transport system permease protein